MKKIIFFGIMVIGIGIGFLNHSNLQTSNNNYYFKHYDVTNGIGNKIGTGIAFDNNGDVGYVSDGGGLAIGTKGQGSDVYTFTNYNATTDGITNNAGEGVAFNSNSDVGYVSNGGGLTIGTKEQGSNVYAFANYNTTTDGITNNAGEGVAFDNNGDIGYVSNGGGLTIGTKEQDNNIYTFTNYNATIDGITNNAGEGVAFNSNGDVGYVSNGGGLTIGTKEQGSNVYTFANYHKDNTDGINDNNGSGVAFDNNDDVGYTSSSGGLSVGIKNQVNGAYAFENYSTPINGITSNSGTGVAFDSKNHVGYIANGESGGLSIGTKKQDSSAYAFQIYDDTIDGITSNDGTGIAFANNGNVGYASNDGLSVGALLDINIDPDAIILDHKNDNFIIKNLTLNFSFLLTRLPSNEYVKIAITDSSSNIYAAYFTNNGVPPSSATKYQQSDTRMFPSVLSFSLENIVGTNGLKENTKFNLTASVGTNENNLIITNSYTFETPLNLIPLQPLSEISLTPSSTFSNAILGISIGLGLGIPFILGTSIGLAYYFMYFKKGKKLFLKK